MGAGGVEPGEGTGGDEGGPVRLVAQEPGAGGLADEPGVAVTGLTV